MKRDGISAIKFEAAQIHFLSDVFVAVAVAVVDAKADDGGGGCDDFDGDFVGDDVGNGVYDDGNRKLKQRRRL